MIPIILFTVLSLDQLTKFLISKNLSILESVPVIQHVFHLTLVANRGAAFGILRNQTLLFIFTSLLAIVLILSNLRKNRHRGLYSFSLSLILSGALGNLIDRLRFGYVIDFLDFRIWPVFNIADSAITIGAILLGWSILFQKDKLSA
ncbi:MAG: lipoprotein signal peptidase [Omnitrophica WOR_2 bacterium SM23_72]|nr:MAG: lipoprotein signal peptidase [Omnitrophica WOR_2 bacterium SM23_72]